MESKKDFSEMAVHKIPSQDRTKRMRLVEILRGNNFSNLDFEKEDS